MRIVAIGLGGAGSRIVDSLYSTDRKSSKVACIQGLAVDVDEDSLKQLTALPENSRLFFPAMDPEVSDRERGTGHTATIDIAEIVSRLHNFESGETDAILICLGLGGSMSDIAPHVITSLRSSIVEPVFGLVTLPCLAEGEKRSAKAADDVDILSPLLDGMILFDNETWYKKTKALKVTLAKKEKSLAHRLGLAKDEPELSPELATYQLLNEGIVRRISLILRAGEFKADGGIDLAEVVLDSGEVLNTMKGMGFITIGYAVERLPSNPLAFLAQFRPQGVFEEENKKKASRIVDLAKQAIYHEISTPCDMTSAHKALVLIAGPSHELSMKGFMTVRKWIDRSIAGLETRSGDYPVVNTKNVAIIIMLSGLENIPRISEIREIRTQYQAWSQKRATGQAGSSPESGSGTGLSPGHGTLRDEMIVLPTKMRKGDEAGPSESVTLKSRAQQPVIAEPVHATRKPEPPEVNRMRVSENERTERNAPPVEPSRDESPLQGGELPPKTSRHRVVVTNYPGTPTHKPVHSPTQKPLSPSTTPPPNLHETGSHHTPGTSPVGTKDAARQRIELELQKQRLKAMSGRIKPEEAEEHEKQQPVHSEPVRKKQEIRAKPHVHEVIPPAITSVSAPDTEQRTVIISKRKLVSRQPETPLMEIQDDNPSPGVEPQEEQSPRGSPSEEQDDEMVLTIRDTAVRAKDRVFEGREVQKPKTSTVKDASLLHTSLKPKKPVHTSSVDAPPAQDNDDTQVPEGQDRKSHKKGKKPDDISWT
jgi:tubulin-like protein CetZ